MISRRTLWRRRHAVLPLHFGAAAVAGLALAIWTWSANEPVAWRRTKVTPSLKTTVVTGPLDQDGYVDFVAALNARLGAGINPADNAAIPLFRALGPFGDSTEITNLVLQELGQPPWGRSDPDFVRSLKNSSPRRTDQAAEDDARNAQRTIAASRPWTDEECPYVALLLAHNERPLAAIAEAAKRPRYYRPLVRVQPDDELMALLLPELLEIRDAAEQLQMRALRHLAQNRLEAARADLLTMHRLARHLADGATLMEGLVGISCEMMAIDADNAWALHPQQTAESIRAYRHELTELSWPEGFTRSIDQFERYVGLDVVQRLARGQGGFSDQETGFRQLRNHLPAPAERPVTCLARAWVAVAHDWDVALEEMNRGYDETVRIARIEDRAQRATAQDALYERLKEFLSRMPSASEVVNQLLFGNRVERSRRVGKTPWMGFEPSVTSALDAEDAVQMRQQVRDVFLAAVQYRLSHGDYPATLSTLVPDDFEEVPVDVFSGLPLRYQLDGTSLKVYSVGRNSNDDGGFGGRTRHEPDDLVLSDPLPSD